MSNYQSKLKEYSKEYSNVNSYQLLTPEDSPEKGFISKNRFIGAKVFKKMINLDSPIRIISPELSNSFIEPMPKVRNQGTDTKDRSITP
jgi:hypothetical protein